MASWSVAIVCFMVLVSISAWAHLVLPPASEVPMQWGLDGKPTWFAPRRLALAFTPAVGAVVLSAMILKYVATSIGLGITFVVSIVLILAYVLHIALARRTLRRG